MRNLLEPLIDEIFHVPQAKLYCACHFDKWDPKLTTFPGLYIYSFFLQSAWKPTEGIVSHYLFPISLTSDDRSNNIEICTTTFLRASNLVLSYLFYRLIKWCRKKIDGNNGYFNNVFSDHIAHLLFVYPLNAFYYFLYYTDTASIATLVAVYGLSIRSKLSNFSFLYQVLLFLSGSASIMMRQTNAVWLLFIVGCRMLSWLEFNGAFRDGELTFVRIFQFISALIKHAPSLVMDSLGLLIPIGLFACFVVHNKGIVVGDKENHQLSLHWAMPLHMFGFLTALLFPLHCVSIWTKNLNVKEVGAITESQDVFTLDKKKNDNVETCDEIEQRGIKNMDDGTLIKKRLMLPIMHIAGLMLVTVILVWGVLSHPFLLADNRHFTFYLWKRFLSKSAFRIIAAPLYYVSTVLSISYLFQSRGSVWIIIYLLAVFITLVPAHLLEPRYFTPGVVIAVLNLPNLYSLKSKRVAKLYEISIHVSILLCYIVNILTIGVFLYRPFQWHDGSTARFMY